MNPLPLNNVRFLIYFFTACIVVLVWLGMIIFLRLKKKKDLVYLFFFTFFYAYIVKVMDYTLFQFQSLLLLKIFTPGLLLRGQEAWRSLNLIPLAMLSLADVKTSFLNVLLFLPFGFGLPFITDLRMKKIVGIGALCSIGIELAQLLTGFVAKMTFRIADVNDVIFNTLGVAVGYMLFAGCIRIVRTWKIKTNPIVRYIGERPQVDA